MRKIRYLIGVIPLLLFWLTTQARAAGRLADCDLAQTIDWRETSTRAFSILYPPDYEVVADLLTAERGEGGAAPGSRLDLEAARFEALFETGLPQPVMIRIYPDLPSYTCLNAGSGAAGSALPPGSMQLATGGREISLLGANILADFPAWAKNDLDLLRYDLATLLTRQIGGAETPPGLLNAVGHYAQAPQTTLAGLQLSRGDWLEPSQDWRSLWEGAAGGQDLRQQVEAVSTVAYLVDTYGWERFLKLLHNLAAAPGIGPALAQVYGVALDELERGWRAYYPAYFNGDWQQHPFYNYDLGRYQRLIQAEQYGEADRQLQAALVFIEKTHNPDKLVEAQALLWQARQGQAANAHFAQAQQAFQNGDYAGSLTLLAQAEQGYTEAQTRIYHLDELAAYRQRVIDVLGLHQELKRLEAEVRTSWNTFWLAHRLVQVGSRLGTLGDRPGYDQAARLLGVIQARQQQQFSWLAAGVLGLVVGLLALLIGLMRRRPPMEAQL